MQRDESRKWSFPLFTPRGHARWRKIAPRDRAIVFALRNLRHRMLYRLEGDLPPREARDGGVARLR